MNGLRISDTIPGISTFFKPFSNHSPSLILSKTRDQFNANKCLYIFYLQSIHCPKSRYYKFMLPSKFIRCTIYIFLSRDPINYCPPCRRAHLWASRSRGFVRLPKLEATRNNVTRKNVKFHRVTSLSPVKRDVCTSVNSYQPATKHRLCTVGCLSKRGL